MQWGSSSQSSRGAFAGALNACVGVAAAAGTASIIKLHVCLSARRNALEAGGARSVTSNLAQKLREIHARLLDFFRSVDTSFDGVISKGEMSYALDTLGLNLSPLQTHNSAFAHASAARATIHRVPSWNRVWGCAALSDGCQM